MNNFITNTAYNTCSTNLQNYSVDTYHGVRDIKTLIIDGVTQSEDDIKTVIKEAHANVFGQEGAAGSKKLFDRSYEKLEKINADNEENGLETMELTSEQVATLAEAEAGASIINDTHNHLLHSKGLTLPDSIVDRVNTFMGETLSDTPDYTP